MCGIAGIFAYHAAALPVERAELRSIRDAMTARGPDGQGEWYSADGRVGFGHRRLSIIDLSERGAQPMTSADGALVVTFNGEIYNYRDLRRDLESRGCQFHSDSDTEVLLHLYADMGVAMLGRLRGMFAFAIWDARKQALLLARDPYGIKPLYYADDGWTLRVASQVKALLAGNQVSHAPEPAGVVGFHLFGSVPEPHTLYQQIHALQAGHSLWVDRLGARAPEAYCSIAGIWADAEQAEPVDVAGVPELIREAVRDSVAHHMIADVPVGAFLSAGIDSGALLGVMADHAGPGHTLNAITLAFEEFRRTPADEAPLAALVAAHYGASHTVRTVGESEFHRDLPRILQAMDQPTIDGINTWFISKAAKESGLKVAISGLGGDELFGGYPSFQDVPRWVRAMWLPTRIPGLGAMMEQVQATFAPLFPRLNPKTAGMLRYGGRYPGSYLLRRGLYLPRELPSILGADLAREGLRRLDPIRHIARQLGERPPKRPFSIVASLEASLYMRNQLLRDTDWASMAHSLEVRTPLVDVQLLRRLARPLATARDARHKRLLAKSPIRPLPDVIVARSKTGFTTPIAAWQQHEAVVKRWRHRAPVSPNHHPWARRWGQFVLANAAVRDVANQPVGVTGAESSIVQGPPLRLALLAPEMAIWGGIQAYMWRLWELALVLGGDGHSHARGWTLNDGQDALARWPHSSSPRPRGHGGRPLALVGNLLLDRTQGETMIVGHVHLAPVAWIRRLLGHDLRYVVVLHGIEAWGRLGWLRRRALARADAVVVTTAFSRDACVAANQLSPENFHVIPLCLPEPATAARNCDALGGGWPILYVGRLARTEQRKGLETVMAATRELRQRGMPVTLHIVGDGDDRARLQAIATADGLGDDAVRFHGTVDSITLDRYYRSARLFVMPSAKEGFGLVFLEAMKHGVPCIGGRHGGTPEVFRDGVEGMLVDYGDIAQLVDAIAALHADPERLAQLGEKAKERFDADYRFPVFVSRWRDLLHKVAS